MPSVNYLYNMLVFKLINLNIYMHTKYLGRLQNTFFLYILIYYNQNFIDIKYSDTLEFEISFDQIRFSLNVKGEEAPDLLKLILFSGNYNYFRFILSTWLTCK